MNDTPAAVPASQHTRNRRHGWFADPLFWLHVVACVGVIGLLIYILRIRQLDIKFERPRAKEALVGAAGISLVSMIYYIVCIAFWRRLTTRIWTSRWGNPVLLLDSTLILGWVGLLIYYPGSVLWSFVAITCNIFSLVIIISTKWGFFPKRGRPIPTATNEIQSRQAPTLTSDVEQACKLASNFEQTHTPIQRDIPAGPQLSRPTVDFAPTVRTQTPMLPRLATRSTFRVSLPQSCQSWHSSIYDYSDIITTYIGSPDSSSPTMAATPTTTNSRPTKSGLSSNTRKPLPPPPPLPQSQREYAQSESSPRQSQYLNNSPMSSPISQYPASPQQSPRQQQRPCTVWPRPRATEMRVQPRPSTADSSTLPVHGRPSMSGRSSWASQVRVHENIEEMPALPVDGRWS
ncbi:hypothetical protein EDC01DRAFT_330838 [Geopyxis carbonaria]|nr:hypothetical protein EDC01DRAFT_330838 [Geopyxis carbonaria]